MVTAGQESPDEFAIPLSPNGVKRRILTGETFANQAGDLMATLEIPERIIKNYYENQMHLAAKARRL